MLNLEWLASYADDYPDGRVLTFADGEPLFLSVDEARAFFGGRPTAGQA